MITEATFHHALAAAADATRDPHIPAQGVLFDFLPDDRLCLVGTNGQRITAVTLAVAHGASGRFFMSSADVTRVLTSFPGGLREIRLSMFMLGETLVLSDTQGTTMEVQHTPGIEGSRYDDTLAAGGHPTGLRYSAGYMLDALRSCANLIDGPVAVGFGARQIVLIPVPRAGGEVTAVRIAIMPVAEGAQ